MPSGAAVPGPLRLASGIRERQVGLDPEAKDGEGASRATLEEYAEKYAEK
jgi:hypothetical protein